MAAFTHTKMYSFRYDDPKTVNVWDRTPLIVPLKITSRHILGANLHHINKSLRQRMVRFLLDLSKTFEKNPSKFSRITYATIKNTPALTSGLKGIRLYIKSRIKKVVELDRKTVSKFMTPATARISLFNRFKKTTGRR